ncbi:MAG: ankyrin repeat domain-containing protein [Acidobacteriota bacterium]
MTRSSLKAIVSSNAAWSVTLALVVLSTGTLPAAQAPRGTTAVAAAAEARDIARVRTLLQEGADVNSAQGDGTTALHWAALRGDTELAAMLLAAGANTRATSRLGAYTPLHLASEAGAAEVIDRLVRAGADVSARTSTGATPLMLAAKSGVRDAVGRLIDHGADLNATETAHAETALMFAAAADRGDVVELLIERGANTRATSTVVDLAALTAAPGEDALQSSRPPGGQGRPGGESAPAAAPARVETPGLTRPFRYNELIGRQGGLTALHFAARQGSARAVEALVRGGADVNLVSPADQSTPLLLATINGQFDIARGLIEKGARVDLASDAGATPLYAAINVYWAPKAFYPQPRAHLQQRTSYLELMQILLDKGADPNARLQRKLWYSSYNFDVLRVEEIGATPFWRAAYASDIDAMRLLVRYGADPHVPTSRPAGRTTRGDAGQQAAIEDRSGLPPVPVGGPGIPPLQAAAGAGYGEGFAGNAHRFAPSGMLAAVKYLVEEHGADVNAEDYDGNVALHHAAARGDVEMILYLIEHGADPKKINREGRSTADMANGPVQRVQPYPEALSLLVKLGAVNHNKCVSC